MELNNSVQCAFRVADREGSAICQWQYAGKVIVEIVAVDGNGDPVRLTDQELRRVRLIDRNNLSSAVDILVKATKVWPDEDSQYDSSLWAVVEPARMLGPGEGWVCSEPENSFAHSFPAASFFSSVGLAGDQIQQRVFWVSTTKVEQKTIVAVLVVPGEEGAEPIAFTTADDTYQYSIICSAISPINYTASNLLSSREDTATGNYEEYVWHKNILPDQSKQKDWEQANYYIAPVPSLGARIVRATYHWKPLDSTSEMSLEQTPAALALGWPVGGTFPLLPLKYAQHDNALRVFDVWSFLPPKEYQDFTGAAADTIAHDAASFQGPVMIGTEAKYELPPNYFSEGASEHTLKTTAEISGNGKSGAVCVSHVCFNDADSAKAYRDIGYLRENQVWVEFVDEYGNPGAFGIVASDDAVKVVSHRLA